MSVIVILQARTNSSRLPAKVLLPVCGVPLAVLAAKRAANAGMKVVVVTSINSSDDALVDTLMEYGIDYFRGSLNNTLKRFVDALSGHDDNEVVIRLTGDNVFPDGALLDEVRQDFEDRKLNYLCCGGGQSGLPYGVSVEITYLKHLRNALEMSVTDFDKEHVMPYIARQFGHEYFHKYKLLEKSLFRSTIDDLDDYLRIKQVFSGIKNPVSAPLFELLERLYLLEDAPVSTQPVNQLVVGGAQLGLNYGVANTNGQPTDSECETLIKTAINNGVEYIDTASAYGESEAVIGRVLNSGWMSRVNIITKLSPLSECPGNADRKTLEAFVEASVYQSCTHLHCQEIKVLMLHRAAHIHEWNGVVWSKLIQLKDAGVIHQLGVSVQSPEELEFVLDEPLITFIQMPYNIMDNRWGSVLSKLKQIKSERKLTVHVRSVFLQGLLLSDNSDHWSKANFGNHDTVVHCLNSWVKKYNRANVAELCLAFVRSQNWVDGIVVGMETTSQLLENINYFNVELLEPGSIKDIETQRPFFPEAVLNPAKWKKG